MRWYKADLHIHSVLSPCAGLEMAPQEVMKAAQAKGLDIIAITDHNSCANSKVYAAVAQKANLAYIHGIEVQTAEEIHVVALFETGDSACAFSRELYDSLLSIQNNPEFFGDQVVIDEQNNIKRFIKKALINSSVWTLETMLCKISDYGGFYFPAHVNVTTYSILGQLGFIPPDLNIIALGITSKCDAEELLEKNPSLRQYSLIRNSDAHYLQDIGSGCTEFFLQEPTLKEIILACKNQDGRKLKI